MRARRSLGPNGRQIDAVQSVGGLLPTRSGEFNSRSAAGAHQDCVLRASAQRHRLALPVTVSDVVMMGRFGIWGACGKLRRDREIVMAAGAMRIANLPAIDRGYQRAAAARVSGAALARAHIADGRAFTAWMRTQEPHWLAGRSAGSQ